MDALLPTTPDLLGTPDTLFWVTSPYACICERLSASGVYDTYLARAPDGGWPAGGREGPRSAHLPQSDHNFLTFSDQEWVPLEPVAKSSPSSRFSRFMCFF